ncbi:hypothetical protein B0A52_02976 [Exophiala mesophila]|uniref:CID domain-containing protein n=1 Tax=Exophiala mesophila TaxID=212818 RepID=A0A438NCK3_EXOME|nr:hypothetical protein B0A52_02976 [Exophiala mesophila]
MTPPAADLSSKFGAPAKKSIFERQKAEAEAKKAREKAETAAVLEDFVKSFDDESDSHYPSKRPTAASGGSSSSGYGPAPGKRHFTTTSLKSGPGSLGPSPSLPKSGPGSLGPPPSFGKKRQRDEYSGSWERERDRDRGMLSYNNDRDTNHPRDRSDFRRQEREEEHGDADEIKAAAKPTLHLSSLPPKTSPAVIKGLFAPSPLTVEDVRILPASSTPSERKSISAIITLAAETPATDIDTMVSHLQNRYLGFGFNLSISRHLSSAALSASTSLGSNVPSGNLTSLPFGAKPIPQNTSLSRAPPPGQNYNRFAPPTSYTSSTPYGPRSNMPSTQVSVIPPSDLKQLKLIHKTVEALLSYGPEFEALLMSRPNIQRDEQWAWLWDSRSTGGVYYRWRLWEILTNAAARNRRRPAGGYGSRPQGDTIFEGQSMWVPPEDGLKFEYTTKIEEFISDDDYNSSDEEEMEEDGGLARRYHDHQRMSGVTTETHDNDGAGYLNPLAKTKLVYLLSRLPDSNSKLRKGDVARVTGFAIEHAGAGADEIVTLITRNIINPFCFAVQKPKSSRNPSEEDEATPDIDAENEQKPSSSTLKDTTATSLVGLYLVSDILSCSASSGVRHAWRYRSLFETQLRRQNVFPILGRAERRYNWGKLKADKWRRSVQSVLSLWEGWCVFPQDAHEGFVEGFLNPPLTAKEKHEQEKRDREAKESDMSAKDKNTANINRWRSVESSDTGSGPNQGYYSSRIDGSRMDVDSGVDGTRMRPDGNEGEQGDEDFADADLDGDPMVDSSDEEFEADEPGQVPPPPPPPPEVPDMDMKDADSQPPQRPPEPSSSASEPHAHGRRARPRAADFDDMFD